MVAAIGSGSGGRAPRRWYGCGRWRSSLACDPWAGLTPGFWLSFGAVGLLLYIGVGRIGVGAAWRAALRAQAAITWD